MPFAALGRTVFSSFFVLIASTLRPVRLRAFALGFLMLPGFALAQSSPENKSLSWDFGVWAAGATGEENTNSFSEAQIFTAGISLGKALTPEIGSGWRRGRFVYGADFGPVFVQFTPRRISGIAFDPVILRWNSSVRRGRVAPFVELGGGAVHSSANFPAGNTSTFNFIARVGGGVQIATWHAQAFEIGCRWWHISNA